ncbi:MAG: sulfatase, partial [Candidatus Aminicenantales bacterium]
VARERVERIKTEKFFLFLHYWDTHPPFHCPRAHMPQVSSGDEEDVLEAKYRGAVRYVDQNIGEFVRFLEEKALLENSLVILTSDHGESLREHNILFDHHGLYDVTTHVPLVWHAPGLFPESRRIPALVQHVDILPTVCDILGTEASGDAFDGQSLLPLISGKTSSIRDHVLIEESCAQRRVALRNLTHKYILAPDGAAPCRYCQRIHGGAEELYDLEKDPDETHNRIRSDPEQAARMRQRLEEILRDLADRRDRDLKKSPLVPRHQEPVIPPKERKKIRRKFKCLGYYD